MSTPTRRATAQRLLTFRVPQEHLSRLHSIAAESDRTLAQLVRYALTGWLAASQAPTPPAADTTVPGHLTVRVPSALADQVTQAATQHATTTSGVVRSAIALWLATVDPTRLGGPDVQVSR